MPLADIPDEIMFALQNAEKHQFEEDIVTVIHQDAGKEFQKRLPKCIWKRNVIQN